MKTPYDKLYSTVKFEKPIIPITACDVEQAQQRVGIVYKANNYRQNIYVNRQNWQKKIIADKENGLEKLNVEIMDNKTAMLLERKKNDVLETEVKKNQTERESLLSEQQQLTDRLNKVEQQKTHFEKTLNRKSVKLALKLANKFKK